MLTYSHLEIFRYRILFHKHYSTRMMHRCPIAPLIDCNSILPLNPKIPESATHNGSVSIIF